MPEIREMTKQDLPWLRKMIEKHFGGEPIYVLGEPVNFDDLDGLVIESGDHPAASLTYRIDESGLEVVTLHSENEGKGYGSALMDQAQEIAQIKGCKTVHLITTNDNLQALGFYQRRGYRLTRVFPDSLENETKVKPHLKDMGLNGIPIRDEIELVLQLP